MKIADVLPFLAANTRGVLATHRSDGRPQLSNVNYGVIEGSIGISTTAERSKTKNMRRDPRASLHVTSDDFRSWAVVDCEVTLGPVAGVAGDRAVAELIALYRTIRGEHPDWDEYARAMIDERRLVAFLRPLHAYGQRI